MRGTKKINLGHRLSASAAKTISMTKDMSFSNPSYVDHHPYSNSKGKTTVDYDDYGIKPQPASITSEGSDGIPLKELEREFNIRPGRILNTLKKYKSLLTMLIKKDPYKTFYSLITQECKY